MGKRGGAVPTRIEGVWQPTGERLVLTAQQPTPTAGAVDAIKDAVFTLEANAKELKSKRIIQLDENCQ